MLYLTQTNEHRNFIRRFDLSLDSEPKGTGCRLVVVFGITEQRKMGRKRIGEKKNVYTRKP